MGSGKGILDLGAELVAGIAYIAYIVVGMALCAISAVYYSEIKDANQSASPSAVACGRSGGSPNACLVAAQRSPWCWAFPGLP